MTPAPANSERSTHYSVDGVVFAGVIALFAEALLRVFTQERDVSDAIGRFLVVLLSLAAIHRFASLSLPSYQLSRKDLSIVALIIIASLGLTFVGRVLALGLSGYAEEVGNIGHLNPDSFLFAIPFATGAILLQSVLGLQVGLIFGITLSLLCAIYIGNQPVLIPYIIVTALVACLSLSRFRRRSVLLKVGVNLSIVSLPFALATLLIDNHFTTADLIVRVCGALFSGFLCAILASGIMPVIEHLGGYVTDMRLIEMATLDHPLLKELSVQAPGTWNHSMVMGMMTEAAAESIGANGVVARVGAYFHDIGKVKKPLYFCENQGQGYDRHEKLSPSMSALIIKSHVKDGIELAHKHRLPKVIADLIPEHHGTNLIEFFYDKAQQENEEQRASGEDVPDVDENPYRYAGPKPQTRESGVLMLADGIEAAVRTLAEPTHDRIQGAVQKLINKIFSSGELDESQLTLRDLHIIAKSFTRVLTGIYHQRIAYAEPAEKVNTRRADSSEGSVTHEVASGDHHSENERGSDNKNQEKHGDRGPERGVSEKNGAERNGSDKSDSEKSVADKRAEQKRAEEDRGEDLRRLGI